MWEQRNFRYLVDGDVAAAANRRKYESRAELTARAWSAEQDERGTTRARRPQSRDGSPSPDDAWRHGAPRRLASEREHLSDRGGFVLADIRSSQQLELAL